MFKCSNVDESCLSTFNVRLIFRFISKYWINVIRRKFSRICIWSSLMFLKLNMIFCSLNKWIVKRLTTNFKSSMNKSKIFKRFRKNQFNKRHEIFWFRRRHDRCHCREFVNCCFRKWYWHRQNRFLKTYLYKYSTSLIDVQISTFK